MSVNILEKYRSEIRNLNENYLLTIDITHSNQPPSIEAFFNTMLETLYTKQGSDRLRNALEDIIATGTPEQCLEVFEQATGGMITVGRATGDQARYWLDVLKTECMNANLKF
jgi:hypothetical protein